MQGINVYSSDDLTNWKYEGQALSPLNGTAIAPDLVVERPKVVYNEPTDTWVASHTTPSLPFLLTLISKTITS